MLFLGCLSKSPLSMHTKPSIRSGLAVLVVLVVLASAASFDTAEEHGKLQHVWHVHVMQ